MENEELLKNYKEAFDKMKLEVGFKANYEELDKEFFITERVLQAGYVSSQPLFTLITQIKDNVVMWTNLMHNWIMPNPHSIMALTENASFNDEDKEQINQALKELSLVVSKHATLTLGQDKTAQANYVDEALTAWKKNKAVLQEMSAKINKNWQAEVLGQNKD